MEMPFSELTKLRHALRGLRAENRLTELQFRFLMDACKQDDDDDDGKPTKGGDGGPVQQSGSAPPGDPDP